MQLNSTSSRCVSCVSVIVVGVAAILALPRPIRGEADEKSKPKQPTTPAAKVRTDVPRHVDLTEGGTLKVRLLDATLRIKTR